jgi:hypothetical protein
LGRRRATSLEVALLGPLAKPFERILRGIGKERRV